MTLYEEIHNGLAEGIEAMQNNKNLKTTVVSANDKPAEEADKTLKQKRACNGITQHMIFY